jgi:hypothetical protein
MNFRAKISSVYDLQPAPAESAPPSDAMQQGVYYHGTQTQKNAEKIWKEGIKPNLWMGDNTLSRPIENRVYITKNLSVPATAAPKA